jgi:hypothetical protein
MTSLTRYLLLFLCAAAIASCGSVNRMTYLRPPGVDTIPVEVPKLDLAEYQKKYEKHDGVFLLSEQTIENVVATRDWEVIKLRRLRYLVLNPEAEWLTTFDIDTDSDERLTDVHIVVTSPEGKSRVFGYRDLKVDKKGDGGHSYKLAYPDVRKGSIIEESYELSAPPMGNLAFDYALQFTVPCEKFKLKYIYPNEMTVQVKMIGPRRAVNYVKSADAVYRKALMTYEATDVPAYESEPYSPYFKEHGDYLQFMAYYGFYGRESSWSSLSREFAQYAIDKESFWSSKLENTVEEVTKGATTKLAKVEAIIGHLQKNVKVGAGGYDDNFVDVLNNGEGNIYMVNGLARAMLEEVGVPSELLLIHSAQDGYFDENYVSMEQLYIPAVGADIDGTPYVVFPYSENMPVGLVPEHLKGQRAMRINKDGFAGFTNVPDLDSTSMTVDDIYDLKIDEEGLITVTEEKTLRGTYAYSMREALSRMKKEEIDKEVKDMLTYSEGDVAMKEYEILNRDDYKKPLVVRMTYTIDNLVTVTPDEVIFQTGGLFSPSINGKWKVDTEERKNPIRIYYDERLNKKITINHPKSWTLTSNLPKTDYSNMLGSISGTYSAGDGTVHVEQVRTLKRADAPREQADDLLSVIGRRSKLYIPTLVFKVGTETASGN